MEGKTCVAVLMCIVLCEGLESANKTDTVANGTVNAAVTNIVPAPAVATTTRRPILQGLRIPCSCKDGQCGCCTGLILERFKQKACMNVTYEPDDFEVTAAISMNQRILYKNSFSGKNPPPMCIRVPRFRFIRFCMEFSNVYFAKRNIHMCVDAAATWQDFTLVEWSFDCIRMGASGVAVIGPEDGGGLPSNPVDEEDQIDEDYDDSARNVPSNATSTTIPIKTRRLKSGDVLFTLDKDYNFTTTN